MTVTRTKDDLTVGDLETTGGKLLPEQGPKRRRCPAGFKLNRRTGICEPKSSKTMKVLNDDWVESNERIQKSVRITKVDEDQRLVFGEVYAPNVPDTQGDFMTTEEIQKMAWEFLATGKADNIDISHSLEKSGCKVVESFVAREGDPDFIEGAWVLGVWCPDEVWEQVKSGELNGFSFFGSTEKYPATVLIEVVKQIAGITKKSTVDIIPVHEHAFIINLDNKGVIVSGKTDMVESHYHEIKAGTATEFELDHNHRFALD